MRGSSRLLQDSTNLRDAESLFRTKPISEIRNVEAATKKEIEEKKEELRQLVGQSYRDLIESADSILLMKSSCESISANIGQIDGGIRSLSNAFAETPNPNISQVSSKEKREKLYGIGSRVKYLVDTPENIWGCLDESMFLEASGRYLRAKEVHDLVMGSNVARDFLPNFPLLQHQWQLVESFKGQISQRSRERLMDQGLAVGSYADALAAVATIDELDPNQVLGLFLDSRRSWVRQRIAMCGLNLDAGSVSSVFSDLVRTIQVTLGQVGELFLQVLKDLPLFYRTVLGTPPGAQLFGGIPHPDEEVRLWKQHREKLESVTVMLPSKLIAEACLAWVKACREDIVSATKTGGGYLIDVLRSGEELAHAEKVIRETLDSPVVLEGSFEWLRSVCGSEIGSPWQRICEFVLGEPTNLWDEIFKAVFVRRMKQIIDLSFEDLGRAINIRDSVRAIVAVPGQQIDFEAYMKKPSMNGGVWFSEPNKKVGPNFKAIVDENDFHSCLSAYFGPEVNRIRDLVDARLKSILEDLLCFFEAQNLPSRLKELAPHLQDECYKSILTILREVEDELAHLSGTMGNKSRAYKTSTAQEEDNQQPAIIVERSLFIGRLLFALRNHSSYIPLVLGSPRFWTAQHENASFVNLPAISRQPKVSLDRSMLDSPKSQKSPTTNAFNAFEPDDNANPKFDELSNTARDLCIKAHSVWILWVSDELSIQLAKDLEKDDALLTTTALSGWEETVIKQEQPNEGPLEIKITLPSMPSLYITSFLFQACQEIHRVGGHVLDKFILNDFAWRLLEKVLIIYGDFLSNLEVHKLKVSEKGVLQVLLDLRFTADILSGGKEFSSTDLNVKEKESSKGSALKSSYRHKQVPVQADASGREYVMALIHSLSQKLDPIDWATYEPYLWENEKQSYQRHAVLFGFLVQLNRMYNDAVKKSPTNAESNILRCATVPRFKYLPISAPALSSRGTPRSSFSTSSDEISSRSSWKAYSIGELSPKLELDDTSSFGVAAPLFKSFMTQVGSKFGESTFRLGSMLSDGRLKDRSAAAMSTFGDILPVPGLLSSLTAGTARSDS